MFYTEILTRKVELQIFTLVSLIKKYHKTTFLVNISVQKITIFTTFFHVSDMFCCDSNFSHLLTSSAFFLDNLEITKINLLFPQHNLSNRVLIRKLYLLSILVGAKSQLFLHHIEKDAREVRRSKEVVSEQNISETFKQCNFAIQYFPQTVQISL